MKRKVRNIIVFVIVTLVCLSAAISEFILNRVVDTYQLESITSNIRQVTHYYVSLSVSIMFLIFCGIGFYINKRLNKWIQAIFTMKDTLKKLEIGVIPEHIPITMNDEIGDLERSVNAFIDRLKAQDVLNTTIAKQFEENRKLLVQKNTEELTKVASKSAYVSFASDIFEVCYHNGYSLGVEMIDIDLFKEVNDTYGHDRGDMYLKAIGQVLRDVTTISVMNDASQVRKGVYSARYGGDEFVLLFVNCTKEEVTEISLQVRRGIQEMKLPNKKAPRGMLSVSQGIYYGYPHGIERYEDYYTIADKVVYYAKKTKDRVGYMEGNADITALRGDTASFQEIFPEGNMPTIIS